MTDLDKQQHLAELVDHSRWLMNNGLANDVIKNQLMAYGAIAHPDVAAVELTMDMEGKTISYTLYVDSQLLKKINKFKELSKSTGFWGFGVCMNEYNRLYGLAMQLSNSHQINCTNKYNTLYA